MAEMGLREAGHASCRWCRTSNQISSPEPRTFRCTRKPPRPARRASTCSTSTPKSAKLSGLLAVLRLHQILLDAEVVDDELLPLGGVLAHEKDPLLEVGECVQPALPQ